MKRAILNFAIVTACAVCAAPQVKAQTQTQNAQTAEFYFGNSVGDCQNAINQATNANVIAYAKSAQHYYLNAENDMYWSYEFSFQNWYLSALYASYALQNYDSARNQLNLAYNASSSAKVRNYLTQAGSDADHAWVAAYNAGAWYYGGF